MFIFASSISLIISSLVIYTTTLLWMFTIDYEQGISHLLNFSITHFCYLPNQTEQRITLPAWVSFFPSSPPFFPWSIFHKQKMTKESSVQHAPKVGRHRVYSNEQRKDRNRQAQAAFRDRRSKYTQTLENAIVNFEETIKNLKESNDQTMKRAQAAEERSHHLASEVESLQRLLGMALADNQRLQAQVTLSSKCYHHHHCQAMIPLANISIDDMLPLSPNSDNLAPDKMPLVDPMLQLFDANPTMAATTTSSSSPMSSAASHDQQFDLFNAAMLTGESHKLAAVL